MSENAIRTAREQAGLTQEQFGEIVALGAKNVSDIERGVAGISISTLKNICQKLSISSDTILFGDCRKNDSTLLVERLERLSPDQFKAIKVFMDQVFLLYARMEKRVRHSTKVIFKWNVGGGNHFSYANL